MLAYICVNKLIGGSHPGTKHGSIRGSTCPEVSRNIWTKYANFYFRYDRMDQMRTFLIPMTVPIVFIVVDYNN